MNNNEWLSQLKELTETEYLKAEENAHLFVKKKLGEQPTLEQFRNKVGGQFNVIVGLMLIAFLGALIVSTFDIFKFVGYQVAINNLTTQAYIGFDIDPLVKSKMFQVSFVLLAEFSVILFLTRWRQEVKTHEWDSVYIQNFKIDSRIVKFVMQFFNIYFVLAVSSISFVFYANWQSGVHWLLAILPPVVTLGVGWVFEELITDWLAQLEKDEKQFMEANKHWMQINREPETDERYQEYLMRSIWGALKSKNQRYDIELDVAGSYKIEAVNRELEKANVFKNALIKKAYEYQHPEISADKLNNMSNLEILRDKMDSWRKGDGLIHVGEFIVDMKKLTLTNTITKEIEYAATERGLKHKVSTKIKWSNNKND